MTLAATMDNYELTGDEWGIALGAQSCNGLSIYNAHLVGVGVSGTFSGNPHILHSAIGAITGPNARIGWCALLGTITSNGTGTWVLHSCWGLSGAQFDFGAGGAQTIYITDWVGGPITIANMAAGDVLYFEGRAAALTLAASCTGGTVYFAGDIALTNNGSGQTINQASRYELNRLLSDGTAFQGADIAAILTDTAEIGTAGAGLTNINLPDQTMNITGNITGNLSGSVGSVTGAVGSVTAAVAITSNIKRNQALNGFTFLMTNSTTHAPSTGLTVTVTRSIDGGAFAAGALSAVTEVGNGIYSVNFAAADLDGKVIVLQATAASSDTTFERIVTQV